LRRSARGTVRKIPEVIEIPSLEAGPGLADERTVAEPRGVGPVSHTKGQDGGGSVLKSASGIRTRAKPW
jgi:hypothetical protein